MKLGPIQIEDALASAAVEPPKVFPVESGLRKALEMFGADGEYWTKGVEQSKIGPRDIRVRTPVETRAAMYVGGEDLGKYVFQETVKSYAAGIAFCSIGALNEVSSVIGGGGPLVETFMSANRQIIWSIPDWNDSFERTWADVKQAFEKAIAYAHERGM